MACQSFVDDAALTDIAADRVRRAAGCQLDVNRQPTCEQQFFHTIILPIALRKPLLHKPLTSITRCLVDKFPWLITTATVYKE